MNQEIKNIIQNRPITQGDLEGAKGYCYKSEDTCVFEQIECTDRDIMGHDSFASVCTKTGKPVEVISFIHCAKCNTRISVKDYNLDNKI